MAEALRRNPPFRAEQVGSLLRPEYLLRSRGDRDAGKIDKKQLTRIEDEAVRDIVNTQVKLGFRSISDGEYRRSSACFGTKQAKSN